MAGKRHRTASAKDVGGNGFCVWETGGRVVSLRHGETGDKLES